MTYFSHISRLNFKKHLAFWACLLLFLLGFFISVYGTKCWISDLITTISHWEKDHSIYIGLGSFSSLLSPVLVVIAAFIMKKNNFFADEKKFPFQITINLKSNKFVISPIVICVALGFVVFALGIVDCFCWMLTSFPATGEMIDAIITENSLHH